MHLKYSFTGTFIHPFVPNGLRAGVTVPLIKDKTRYFKDIVIHRPITLMPVISELDICCVNSILDELKFGFKQGNRCVDC